VIEDYDSADELAEAIEEQVEQLVAGVRAVDAQMMNLIAKLRRYRSTPGDLGMPGASRGTL
jgi:hypothetical protein